MRKRPERSVWRKAVNCNTTIYLTAVNWNCTSATFDWPDNNYRITFIPDCDGWVIALSREKINPADRDTRAVDAGQISRSVFGNMAQWALEIFQRKIMAGYDFFAEQSADQQLRLF